MDNRSSKAHWERVYAEKSPTEVSWYQKEPIYSLALIRKLDLKKSDCIIDVGGGASTLSNYLLSAGFQHITVLDLSGQALQAAKQQLGEQSSKIRWLVEDVTAFEPAITHQFSLWHDRAVFHFLTDRADRVKYVASLKKSVKLGGHVIIAAFAIGGPKKCSGLDIVQYDAEKLEAELGPQFCLIEEQSEKHITPVGSEQAFGYFVFVRNSDT